MFTCPTCNYTTKFASSHILHARLCGVGEPIEAIDYAPRPARSHIANTQDTPTLSPIVGTTPRSHASTLPRVATLVLETYLVFQGVSESDLPTALDSRLSDLEELLTPQQLSHVLTIANS